MARQPRGRSGCAHNNKSRQNWGPCPCQLRTVLERIPSRPARARLHRGTKHCVRVPKTTSRSGCSSAGEQCRRHDKTKYPGRRRRAFDLLREPIGTRKARLALRAMPLHAGPSRPSVFAKFKCGVLTAGAQAGDSAGLYSAAWASQCFRTSDTHDSYQYQAPSICVPYWYFAFLASFSCQRSV